MKKLLLTSLVVLFSIVSQADIINCSFTEPFINTSYSMAQQSLTYSSYSGPNGELEKTVVKNVSFQIKSVGLFELIKDGKVLQTLTLDNKGSDGMSDNNYPYSVKDNSMLTGANGGYGGCQSNSLKTKSE